jgi:hypothetical protein
MTKDEALKLALAALENMSTALREEDVLGSDIELMLDAITTIRETLAQPDEDAIIIQYHEATIKRLEKRIEELTVQPEQEPVAYIDVEQRRLQWAKPMSWNTPTTVNLPKIPLYTAPPQPEERPWVGLTDDEIKDALVSVDAKTKRLPPGMKAFAQAVEAKLKEKNT